MYRLRVSLCQVRTEGERGRLRGRIHYPVCRVSQELKTYNPHTDLRNKTNVVSTGVDARVWNTRQRTTRFPHHVGPRPETGPREDTVTALAAPRPVAVDTRQGH